MGRSWQKKYHLISDKNDAPTKSKLSFIKTLENFLADWEQEHLNLQTITDDEIGIIFTVYNMEEMRLLTPHLSLFQFEKLLNERIARKIRSLCSDWDGDNLKLKLKQYRHYFHSEQYKWTVLQIYIQFLNTTDLDFSETSLGLLDIYDAAAMGLIYHRIFMKKPDEEYSQIIIDEAQDFGEMIYYVLKQLLPECFFTIMGDVSQNIHFETGLNDWETLKTSIFNSENDRLYLLSKSYRNTIEISECAGKILEKASLGNYKIQPVIRHGQQVQKIQVPEDNLPQTLVEILESVKRKNFETIAVICRTDEEAVEVSQFLNLEQKSTVQFQNGVMVLPVSLTKGLEFDVVILWKPDDQHYGANQKEAKLLYVAVTRALHELYMIGDKEVSKLTV